MIAIQSSISKKCTPHLLPARINHNGPVSSTSRYWTPETDEKGTSHAYLRGRHLHGTHVSLPSTHTGAVLHITDKTLPQTRSQGAEDEDEDEDEDGEGQERETVDVKLAEQMSEFDEVVVWGHGGPVEAGQDMFIRGVKELIGFAEAMHGEEEEEVQEKKDRK
ncbi:ribonuclease H1 small subunit [Bimuria novae-zelandiae CBS 107.79]|uniref:Ribonuclease H1 small subunit n=1 Tax=Bimuria novae-zelandiae CBS 107.79 TaxID=1447943 RepID=A0A6A5UQZ9_9PLEO|nr:ribonuclease H1 small subunit [Bimuria novae-zelandiae CBS 107.79]